MTNLGLWAPYVNEAEMLGWYNLPRELALECQRYQPAGRELQPLASGAYRALERQTHAYADRSVQRFRPAYHHADHFRETEANGLAAADAYARGNQRKMPEAVRQAFGLALYSHDVHHCASTFRSQARRGIYRPELGSSVSSEWVSALSTNEFMARNGLPLPARLFQTYVIYASTYGGTTSRGKRLGIPVTEPTTIWGVIMRAADVAPAATLAEWLRLTIAVNYGEVPATPAPQSWDEFAGRERGFLGYVQHCLDRMDAVAGMGLSSTLGWRQRANQRTAWIDQLADRTSRVAQLAQQELGRNGVTLS